MIQEDKAFIQAIIDDPQDDSLRMIYADWLEERGDPRGEFIRVQVALARDDHDGRALDKAKRKVLKARESTLLKQHREEWERPLTALGAARVEFRRGFPYHINITAEDFISHATEIVGLAPVESARIWARSAEIEALMAVPQLAKLTALDLSGMRLGRERVAALASCPYLGNLTTLALKNAGINEAEAQVLAGSQNLANLTTLDLSVNLLGDAGVRSLAESRQLRKLTALVLRSCYIGYAGVQALAASPNLKNVTSLNMSHNHIGVDGAHALASSRQLTNLTTLNLYWNYLGNAEAQALAAGPNLGNVTDLNLEYNLVGNEGAMALAVSRHLKQLTRLELRGNHDVGIETVQEIEQRLARRDKAGARRASGRRE
jgi:uncharacterized protein (TIGR02996 family)